MLNILASQVRALARNRIGYAVFSGVKAAVSSLARVFYVLWLQTTGLVFAAFTAMGGASAYRLYRAHSVTDRTHSLSDDPRKFWITVIFTVVCFGFTVMSFWKAKSRSR
jgi:uncharacterized membrane protein